MKNSTPQNITSILDKAKLKKIVEKANTLNDLNAKIQQKLPPKYKGLYRISHILETEIVFDVQSATVKIGLELQKKNILSLIKVDFPNITNVSFHINPSLGAF